MQKQKWIIFITIILIDILLYLFAFGNEKTSYAGSVIILMTFPFMAYIGSNFSSPGKKINKDNLLLPGILLVTAALYIPSLKYGFTNWDDTEYIINNRLIKGVNFEKIMDIFTTPFKGMYQPLSIFSLLFDYIPAKLNPIHYHLTNLILHLVNTYLIYNIIRKIFANSNVAIISAILFGIHTVHTESVIWVSERKDVLYTLFFLLSIFQYLLYRGTNSYKRYYYSILFFLLSLLAKPQGVMLPFVLLLIDYLQDDKLKTTLSKLMDKSPFFALSLVFGSLTIYLSEGKTPDIEIFERIVFGLYSYTAYIFQLFVPTKLSVIYPYPKGLDFVHYFSALICIAILIWGYLSFRKNKKVFFGIAFFTLNIILLLQFIPNTYVVRADRYNYVASIGIFILLGILYNTIISKFINYKGTIRILAISIGIILLISSYNRGKVWESSVSLWNDTLEKYPYISEALNNRGHAYYLEGDYEAAVHDFNQAILTDPKQANPLINLGTLYLKAGFDEKAKTNLSIGLDNNPQHVNGLINRGITYINTKEPLKAMEDFDKAISIDPYATDAYINKGTLYESLSEYPSAIIEYNKAIEIDPDRALSYANRGLAYARSGNENKALSDFNRCIKLDPKIADAHSNRGFIYYKMGNYNQAIVDLSRAIKLNPELAIAYMNRGNTYIALGEKNKACLDFQKASSLGLAIAGNMIDQYCR